MADTYNLGTGFLQILPRTNGFVRQLKNDLRQAKSQVGDFEVDVVLDPERFRRQLRELQRETGGLSINVRPEVSATEWARFEAQTQARLSRIDFRIRVGIDVDDDEIDRIGRRLGQINIGGGRGGGGSFGLGMLSGLARMATLASAASLAVGSLAGPLAALTSGLVAVGAAAGGAAIAGIGALGLAVGTLKVGLQGIGDALKGDADGDCCTIG
ncbi:hypothetical protein [Tsukamurella pulmonis]|uniref:hypothetical protein n=1 Tax=Tsukamurella pulmonis TaxID=47312 RepID=UPI000AC56D11|nr:hypothetical protein [Tsukamurella pulmonis]